MMLRFTVTGKSQRTCNPEKQVHKLPPEIDEHKTIASNVIENHLPTKTQAQKVQT